MICTDWDGSSNIVKEPTQREREDIFPTEGVMQLGSDLWSVILPCSTALACLGGPDCGYSRGGYVAQSICHMAQTHQFWREGLGCLMVGSAKYSFMLNVIKSLAASGTVWNLSYNLSLCSAGTKISSERQGLQPFAAICTGSDLFLEPQWLSARSQSDSTYWWSARWYQ